jgi:hypothetical protein
MGYIRWDDNLNAVRNDASIGAIVKRNIGQTMAIMTFILI